MSRLLTGFATLSAVLFALPVQLNAQEKSIVAEFSRFVAERFSTSTSWYKFSTEGVTAASSVEQREFLNTLKAADPLLVYGTQIEFTSSGSERVGWLVIDAWDPIVCSGDAVQFATCYIGVGVRGGTVCRVESMLRGESAGNWARLLVCELTAMYGTGLFARGEALFLLDRDLAYLGYLSEFEYVSGYGTGGTVTWEASNIYENETNQIHRCISISFVPDESASTDVRKSEVCESYAVDMSSRTILSEPRTASLSGLLMNRYESEARSLANIGTSGVQVDSELANVRSYFGTAGGPSLLQAQALMMTYGTYEAEVDGIWGPETNAAFKSILETYIAIGGRGEDWGINTPADTQRFLNWLAEAAYANANGTEFPD